MSYKSPIEIIYGDMTHKLENEVFTVIQNIGISIDKDELIKALQYDRNQYEKGYADAMMNVEPVQHGHIDIRVINPYDGEDCYCSVCGHWSLLPNYKWCPYCGAKMDGDGNYVCETVLP